MDAAQEKEKNAKTTMAALKLEIANLNRLVEQGAGLSLGQENTVHDLLADKQKLVAEVAHLRDALQTQTAQIDALNGDADGFEAEKAQFTTALGEAKAAATKANLEAEREGRRAQRLQDEMLGLKQFGDRRELEMQQLSYELEQTKGEAEQLRLAVKDGSLNLERYDGARGSSVAADDDFRFRRVGDDLRQRHDEFERRIEGYVKGATRAREQIDALQEQVQGAADAVRRKNDEVELLKKKAAKAGKDLEAANEKKQVRVPPLIFWGF